MSTASATAGWRFNQIGIRVADLARTLHFYCDVLGMTELGRMPADTVEIVFLGYPVAGADGDGGQGMSALFDREGVLEVIYSQHSPALITNSSHNASFGLIKLAFTVPDLAACMARLKSQGVKVLKEAGSTEGLDDAARGIGAEDPSKGRNQALWQAVSGVGFAEDPDGYLIEFIQY